MCGQVLEKCPNKCLAYVQRLEMNNHLLECPKLNMANNKTSVPTVTPSPLKKMDNNNEITMDMSKIEEKLLQLETDVNSLR